MTEIAKSSLVMLFNYEHSPLTDETKSRQRSSNYHSTLSSDHSWRAGSSLRRVSRLRRARQAHFQLRESQRKVPAELDQK